MNAVDHEHEEGLSFGAVLRRYRIAARLSQQALAERAGLTAQAISVLERGERKKPYRATVRLLAGALRLSTEQTRLLEALASRRRDHVPPDERAPGAGAPRQDRHNLPAPLTSLVGRSREVAEVQALLLRPDVRLLTLWGAGGVGKTRLALEVAAACAADHQDGARLVELASVTDAALVLQAAAAALGVREEPGRGLLATLSDYFAGRRVLLVLDNCEHVIAPCAELVETLLRTCPGVRILATSRERLEVAGEQSYQVPPLAVPDLARMPPPESILACDAVRLFVKRAQARQPPFDLDTRQAALVAQICARLDGIPLAIELAAALVGTLPVEEIAARLDHRFDLLTGGPRTAIPRHKTLRAVLDWSYDLLREPEQALLQRLSVFAGGWSLEALKAVLGGADGLGQAAIVDALIGLVNKSLVGVGDWRGATRYRLLETVRQYAKEKLESTGEEPAVRDRHLQWCLALAAQAEPLLLGPEQGAWLERLEVEHDNLRAALAWSIDAERPEAGVRLAGALWHFWWRRGYLSEGRRWLARALARSAALPAALRAPALNGAGNLAWAAGDLEQARALHEECLALRRELADTPGIAGSLNNLALVASNLGDLQQAAGLARESLALRRELGDSDGIARTLNNYGSILSDLGDHHQAELLYRESLALKRELGDAQGIAAALVNLGVEAYAQGDYGRAAYLHAESLAIFDDIGEKGGIAECLEGRALTAAALDQFDLAATLFGAAAALRGAIGARLALPERALHERVVAEVRAALGAAAFVAAWDAGGALPLERAVAAALDGGPGG